MGQLLIRQFELSNVTVSENSFIYRILYKLPYITLSGISLRLYDVTITPQGDYYSITIHDKDSLHDMKTIDTYFSQYHKYEPFLKLNSIHFRKSTAINKIISKHKDKSYMDISILKIKKHASRCFPIVYIL